MPLVTLFLVTLNALVYALELESGGMSVCADWGFTPAHASLGTAVSSMFLHDPSSLLHLGGNLVFLVVFGAIIERELGGLRFAALYAVAGLGGAAVHYLVDPTSATALVGCSGCLFGLIAFSVSINRRLVGFALAFGAVNVWYALGGGGGYVSFGAHIGGLLVGTVCALAQTVVGEERFA